MSHAKRKDQFWEVLEQIGISNETYKQLSEEKN